MLKSWNWPSNIFENILCMFWDLKEWVCKFKVLWGATPGERDGTQLQYSCLENPMDGRAWQAAVHGVARSQIRLNDLTLTFHFSCIGEGNGNPLQCSRLENPRDGEPGRLQSMGLLRVGYDWAISLWLFTFLHWRRKWQPTPVFLPGESQGRGSLVGCCPWGCTESNAT